MSDREQQWTAFIFGVIFVIVMLVLAILFPHPAPFPYLVFRVVLALAAAGVVAMIPGFLTAEVGNFVRAGGAVAAFVIVFFFSPAALVATPEPLKEHVGFLSVLQEHFQKRVPSKEYRLTVVARSDVDVGRFWVDETTDESWEGFFRKICGKYSKCMVCDVSPGAARIDLNGQLAEGLAEGGARKLTCRA